MEHLEKEYFEELFEMETGYVLNFTNKSFERFFKNTLDIEIYNDKYGNYGNSKANRLRAFWDEESDDLVGQALSDMLDRFVFKEQKEGNKPEENAIYPKCREVADRLLGKKVRTRKKSTEEEFIDKEFKDVTFDGIGLDPAIKKIMESRFVEAHKCLETGASLATIFLCGSILEGLLLGVAEENPKTFNKCEISPKDQNDKVKKFNEWSLAQFIDVAYHLEYLKLDVKKFSHGLRDFRNYIHPYEQKASEFDPDIETARICMQVLRAAIVSLNQSQN
ncbi:MAG: hypothetical protein U5K69_23355 [Balneolaceae bacterium]|nr:hypothetical protein [Balneolaceae bacterium]